MDQRQTIHAYQGIFLCGTGLGRNLEKDVGESAHCTFLQGGGEGAELNALMDNVYNMNLEGWETMRGVRPLARHILPY